MSRRFDQCTETCTTDCGHCKGQPVAELRAEVQRLRSELRDKRNDLLDVRGLLSPNGGESVLPDDMADIGKRVAPAVEWLIGEVRRLRELLPWGTATPPSWQQIAEAAVRQRDTLRARIQHIHRRNEHHPHYCVTCRGPHPCSTIRALDETVEAVANHG
jgi:hypothetical protein